MDERTDSELILAYRQTGDTRLLDMLVRRHIGKVRSMIYAMVLNEADADELTQEVFLRAIAALSSFESRAAFSTWLVRITLNTTRTFLKRKNRNPVEIREDPPDPPDSSFGRAHDRMRLDETDAAVTAALLALSPRLRAALTLTVLQGCTIREAARIEGCLTATLYWRIHEARRQLRASLEGKGFL